ncbi:uncharacterized protein LOC126675388 [Mercurialis annua]|uniref:uncharacterized protein LOC126675388 n=1 Tax=Mercurialis annua TaxID=3986 RepID=UPI0021600BCD|nr:uncharacterized protein LOC126675388 [Mercurialis annua]XP_050225984.1 uncharacterized protein LOC126675388 [Mercurialis annua]
MEPFYMNIDSPSIEEPSFEQLIHPMSPEISDISRDPQLNPRVGSEYQAEIPPMISESEYSCLLLNPLDSQGSVDGSCSFLMGLPFPVTWVCIEASDKKKEDKGCRMNNTDKSYNASSRSRKFIAFLKDMKNGSKQYAEPPDLGLGDGHESKPANLRHKVAVKANLSQLHKYKNFDLAPGSFYHPWSDSDKNHFILGLYIFGKSFFQIKRFIGKKMGDILCFYYGDFYRSDGYRRWSRCRKKKRKKCIYGEKLFTGWRQQEIRSRLLPHVPEHMKIPFAEVFTAFSEGRSSTEDLVTHLQAMVGVGALVDAIGIGKGKDDLTNISEEHVKNNQLLTDCLTGKACSSLTSGEIIKLLTGGFRLSKARSNDIFWEAVWPRLLARGWHSELPKDQMNISIHSLVFLVPGVKKFSKRKLVKGNHYFDSVSDVLSKVASEPNLIELPNEEAGGSACNEEDRWVPEVSSDHDDPSIQQSHRYLKPRVSSCNIHRVKFTIVDSGLIGGGKLSKTREMSFTPEDLKVKSLLTTLSVSSSIGMKFLEDSQNNDELEVSDTSMDGLKNINKIECNEKISNGCGSNRTKFTVVDTSLIDIGKSSKVRELRYSPVDLIATSGFNPSLRNNEGNSLKESLDGLVVVATNKVRSRKKKDRSKDMTDRIRSDKKDLNEATMNKLAGGLQDSNNLLVISPSTGTIKHKFSRRPKSSQSDSSVPVVKLRRLTACNKTEISHVIDNFSVSLGSKPEVSLCALNTTDECSNSFQVITPEELSITTSLVEGCAEPKGENLKYQTPCVIDLNLPTVLLNSENDESAMMKGINVNDCADADAMAEQPDMNPRRQSKRNRPLTAKALEALECGFLGSSTLKRQKSMQIGTQGKGHQRNS